MSDRIGRYEIQAELGRGGFGQVFRAYDPTVGRLVAIKTLTSGGDPELIRRFRNEAAAAGKLRHRNIVIIYDFGDHEGSPYLVMELLDGEDLDRIVARNRPLTLLDKVDIIAQSASGLHHAHSNGIVHRDIKPANIMLQRDGVVKIMDFGIALLTQATAARITPKGSIIGTFPYMAPEQFQGSVSDQLTDIFSFGVTSYKLLTGVHPFEADEMAALMYNIMHKVPEPIRALNPDCPEALEQAVFRMIAKDRESRYQNLEDARFDLEPVIAELRKEQIHDLLAEARNMIAANRLDAAQGMLRRVLEADPANRTARELRETLQLQIRENEIRPRIAALVNEGKEELQARRFDQAIQKFQSALQLNKSNTEVQDLIAQALSARGRAERAARIVESVENWLKRGDLTAARSGVLEALAADPENAEARHLREAVEARLDARERERRLEEGLSHARRLMLLESYGEAITALEALTAEHPSSSAARELLARARSEQQAQERRRRLQAVIEEAKTLLKNGRFAEAVERLSASRQEFPESAELRDLASFAADELQSQKQAEAVERAKTEAARLIEAQKFDEAVELLRATLAEYPGVTALRDWIQGAASAKSEYERRAALDEAVKDARQQIAGQRFREAMERMAAYVRAYGDSAEFEPLRRSAEEGLENQRRAIAARQLAAKARALLDEGRPDSATEMLHSGTVQFPADTDLKQLLTEAEGRLLEQRKAEAISRVIAEAESLARARHFDRALSLLDKGLQEHAGAERLVRCRQATVAGRVRYEREQGQRKALEEAQAFRQAGNLGEALGRIHSAIGEFGETAPLTEMRRQLEGEQHAHEREAAVRSIVDEAKTLLDRGHFASATQLLQQGRERFPGEDRLAKLKEVAEVRAREQQRLSEIEEIANSARAHLEAGRFDIALRQLESGLARFGAVAEFESIRQHVLAAKTARERQLALDEAKKQIRKAQAAGELAEALEGVLAGLKRFGSDPELAGLKTELETEQAHKRREQEARTLVKRAEDLLSSGRTGECVALLEKASQFGDDPRVVNLLGRARGQMAAQEREAAIRETERNAQRLMDGGKYIEALQTLDAALKQYPGTDRLAAIRRSVQAARERSEALADARSAYSSGDLNRAVKIVRSALERAPDDPDLRGLKASLETEIERRRRDQVVQKAAEEAEALLAGSRPKEALAALRPALALYPGDTRLTELLQTAEADNQRREFEAEIASVAAQAETLIAQQEYDEAIRLVNGRFAGVDRLQPLVARAQHELTLKRQREAREQALAQLLALEQQIPSTRKSKLGGIVAESRRIAAVHSGDDEISGIASRIERQVNAILTAPVPPRRPLPWKWIGAGAAAVALAAAGITILPKLKRPVPSTYPVEIRTDPAGALVTVGDQQCTSPNCRLDLKPGSYTITAQLRGYKPAEQPLNIVAGRAPAPPILTLEPEPPPPPPPTAATGTLVVRAGVAGVRVIADDLPIGLTDARGDLTAKLPVRRYRIHVEKAGYQASPSEQQVLIKDQPSPERVPFKLQALPAHLALRGAPAGVEVVVGSGRARRTDGSPLFTVEAPIGDQTVRVAQGGASNQFPQRFEPGATVTRDWDSIAPAKPPAAAVARPEIRDDWTPVRNSTDPNVLEAYIRNHPANDPHIPEATALLDNAIWLRSNKDTPALRAYLDRFPKGAHAREADDLLWSRVNAADVESLRDFVRLNPSSAHKDEAVKLIDRLTRVQSPPATSSQPPVSTQIPSPALVSAQDRQGIEAALQRFNKAFEDKSPHELKAIWPGASKLWLESMNQRGAYFTANLYATGQPDVKGNSAVLPCDLITQTILRGKPQPQSKKSVIVTLRRIGDQWLIGDPLGTPLPPAILR